jgi:hypothetical protein
MNALAILTDARDHGVKVTVEGDKLILEGDITPKMVATFKANKPAILKVLAAATGSEKTTAETTHMACEDPMGEALGVLCDDCGRPTVIAVVTDCGARYCRECVFPDTTHSKTTKAPVVPADTQGELVQ